MRAIRRAKWFLGRMTSQHAPTQCTVLGEVFEVHEGVFSPAYSRATAFYSRQMAGLSSGQRVLEVGCGSGAISVHCAKAGATRVIGTDINLSALVCSRANAVKHGVDGKVSVVACDSLGALSAGFDIAFFALPYVYVDNVSFAVERYGMLAYSVFDEGYAAQRKFLLGVREAIATGSRAFIGFSIIGVQSELERNLDAAQLSVREVAVEREGRADNRFLEVIVA